MVKDDTDPTTDMVEALVAPNGIVDPDSNLVVEDVVSAELSIEETHRAPTCNSDPGTSPKPDNGSPTCSSQASEDRASSSTTSFPKGDVDEQGRSRRRSVTDSFAHQSKRESTFSDTILGSHRHVRRSHTGLDDEDMDGPRKSVVGPLNPRPSRRASFALQMLMPMSQQGHPLAAGTSSRRTSAVHQQDHARPIASPSGVSVASGIGGRRSTLQPPAVQPRRVRSSSFALNNVASVQGFQAQLKEQLSKQAEEQQDRGRKKSLVRSRTSVVGLEALINQANAKLNAKDQVQQLGNVKEDMRGSESMTSGGEVSIEGQETITSPSSKTGEGRGKLGSSTVTDDTHPDNSDSEDDHSDDESPYETNGEGDDDGTTKKIPLGRRFTRLLPAPEKETVEDYAADHLPWIFSTRANMIFGGLIMLNAAYIGIETDFNKELPTWFWFVVEFGFVAGFALELLLRVKNHSQAPLDIDEEPGPFWRSPWNIMDAVIVSVGIVDTIIITVFVQGILGSEVGSRDKGETSKLSFVTMIRLMRILRLLRVLRIFRFLRELLLLAAGILVAMKALVWAMMLVFLTLYTCSIFATKLIGQEVEGSSTDDVVIDSWFGSVPKSMFTLFQLMTLEEWSNVARTVADRLGWWCSLFFIIFVMFTNLVLLNLVTGVILENVLAISKREEEKALQKEEAHRMQTVFKIHNLFDTVLGDRDTDELTIEEFRSACCNPRVVRHLQSLQIATYEAEELFILMDTAKRGAINIDHFIEGCLRIRGAARAKHLLAVQFDVQKVWSKLSDQLDEVEDRLVLEVQRTAEEGLEFMMESVQDAVKEAAEEAFEHVAENKLVEVVTDTVKSLFQEMTGTANGASDMLLMRGSMSEPVTTGRASSSSQAPPEAWTKPAEGIQQSGTPDAVSKDEPRNKEEPCNRSKSPAGKVSMEKSKDQRSSALLKGKSLLAEELHALEESHEEHVQHSWPLGSQISQASNSNDQEDSDDERYVDPTAGWDGSHSDVVGLLEAAPSSAAGNAPVGVGAKQDGDTGERDRKKSRKSSRNRRSNVKIKEVEGRIQTLHREEDGLLRRLATNRDKRTAELALLSRLACAEEQNTEGYQSETRRTESSQIRKSRSFAVISSRQQGSVREKSERPPGSKTSPLDLPKYVLKRPGERESNVGQSEPGSPQGLSRASAAGRGGKMMAVASLNVEKRTSLEEALCSDDPDDGPLKSSLSAVFTSEKGAPRGRLSGIFGERTSLPLSEQIPIFSAARKSTSKPDGSPAHNIPIKGSIARGSQKQKSWND